MRWPEALLRSRFSASGRAWLPGCQAGWAGFCGPWRFLLPGRSACYGWSAGHSPTPLNEAEEVDEFLDRIMHSLVRGERGSLRQLNGEARFPTVKLRPGYVRADVDSLLASVEHAIADLAC